MATPVQRLQSIGDALLNRVATPTELGRISDAVGFMSADTSYATKTNAQKADATVAYIRKHLLTLIRQSESQAAEQAARDSAAAAVDADFAATP